MFSVSTETQQQFNLSTRDFLASLDWWYVHPSIWKISDSEKEHRRKMTQQGQVYSGKIPKRMASQSWLLAYPATWTGIDTSPGGDLNRRQDGGSTRARSRLMNRILRAGFFQSGWLGSSSQHFNASIHQISVIMHVLVFQGDTFLIGSDVDPEY